MGNPAAGKQAVQLTPMDPESHLASAEMLNRAGQPAESILEVEKAIALRPSDYSLWLALGLLRDQNGDTTAALAAFDEAVKRAPFYAQPRWQRGNVLLRSGQYEAAFKDLNQASRSEPELIPNLIDLAWSMSKGDPKLTEQLAQVDTDRRRIAFARLLVRHGNATESLAQFKAIRLVPGEIRGELLGQLLAKDAFKEAYEIWKSDQPGNTESLIHDGGFEAPLTFDQGGFGWRVTRTMPGVTLAVDSSKTHTGSKSLRLEFTGDSTAESPVVSQLILVEPSRRYRISFAARPENVVSGGLPIVAIKAAGANSQLGHSPPLSKGTRDWEVLSFEFDVPGQTTAIFVSVQRENCATSPCPAFGSIWLDSFSVKQLK
jgi:hypothetical protein